LNRTVLRLLGAELRPLLGLVRARLLGLDRAGVGLHGANLRLLWLHRANLRLVGPVVRVFRPKLRLAGAVVRLYGSGLGRAGTNFGLSRPYVRLAGSDRLDLGLVIWFARAKS
jgi:hypothetical protein